MSDCDEGEDPDLVVCRVCHEQRARAGNYSCNKCRVTAMHVAALGDAIRRFVRRAEVTKLVEVARDALTDSYFCGKNDSLRGLRLAEQEHGSALAALAKMATEER